MRTTESRPAASGSGRLVQIGAVLWVAVLQYFVLLLVVQNRWTTPYSWVRNAISDLGAATCRYSDSVETWVCSPWHRAANVSWFLAGLCLTAGALLLMRGWSASGIARTGLGLYALAGVGLMVVALNPEDVRAGWHVAGAVAAIVGGEVAMIVLGFALLRADRLRGLGLLGVGAGVVAVVGLILMLARVGGAAHFGLWERIAAFPVLLYAIVCGLRILIDRAGRWR
ncbi:DUF998 domain-containing protein [Nocardia sp. NPDC050712]|uniref:DUF998 domain-containing protein n=1 Tax=Nocardia sp. NPDC050712 TaxID=3155518 RepID=UPI0033D5C894